MKVHVKLYGRFPECQDKPCMHRSECANHHTAGDYRIEDGMTSDLLVNSKGEWSCSKSPVFNHGAILSDGRLAREWNYNTPDDLKG